jgi:hypothetical protein
MRKAQRHIPKAMWFFVLGVGLIATPSVAQLGSYGNQLWYQDVAGIRDASEPYDMFGNAVATGDFDNDGYDDVAIGVASEEFVGGLNVGAVGVLYGGPSGPSALFDDLWHQDSAGIIGVSEANDWFGRSLAAGDFDGDGYDDLAIGIPLEDVGNVVDAGAVQILYGSAIGLSATGNQLWTQDNPDILGGAEEDDRFGTSLAAGDFNNFGYDDLAIGVPGENPGGGDSAGVVNVLYGTAAGLSTTDNQIWSQDTPGILGGSESFDGFGRTLAVGDFDHDFCDDLAISAPTEGVGEVIQVGVVHILYGTCTTPGLTATGNQIWSQDTSGILGDSAEFEHFGQALATGDFDNDSFDDIAIGVPEEDMGGLFWIGAVNILYGTAAGLSATGNQLWNQDSPGILGGIESGDSFGSSLAVGDFSRNGFDDLAIGVPSESLGGGLNQGVVHILPGSAAGLSAIGNQLWHQDSPGMLGAIESNDEFGEVLAAGDFDNNGFADLAVGIPEEDIGTIEDAGAIQILFGGLLIFSDGFESGGTSAWSATAP